MTVLHLKFEHNLKYLNFKSSTMDLELKGIAHLIHELDKKLLVVLKDGRTFIGYLRSVDQFATLVFQSTIERIYVGKDYGDVPRGTLIIRGENITLLGEIDSQKEDNLPLNRVSTYDILNAQHNEKVLKQAQRKMLSKSLKERGLNCFQL